MITKEHSQEALSLAYIHAIAGLAGLNLGAKTTFDYGIDGVLWPVANINGEYLDTGHPLKFQMKATTQWAHEGDDVVYDLSARTHRVLTLRKRGAPLAVLILLCLPENTTDWLGGSENHLRLRNCCYWYRPAGPPTDNTSTIRIRIPRANILTPDSLQAIMNIAREEAEAGL